MHSFIISMTVFVDIDDDKDAPRTLTGVLCNSTSAEIRSVRVLAIHKQNQIPALCRAEKGTNHGRDPQRPEIG